MVIERKYPERVTCRGTFQKYRLPIIMFIVFEAVAVCLWQFTGKIFLLFQLHFIGCLFRRTCPIHQGIQIRPPADQFGVGLYMLVYLGLYSRENMMLEGFWLFCSWASSKRPSFTILCKNTWAVSFRARVVRIACWTAMVLDLLP